MSTGVWRVRKLLKEHPLVFGFIAALIPLIILLIQQFVWLTELDKATALAHRSALRSFLSAVGDGVEHSYRATAERLLNVPSDHLQSDDLRKVADYWKTKPRNGVQRLFIVDYSASETGNFYTYVPKTNKMVSSTSSDETLAIILATLPWQRWAREKDTDRAPMLHVNEQDPDYRIVLKPIVDERAHIVGVAGFVVDQAYVRNELLAEIIDHEVSSCFSSSVRGAQISVTDERGRTVLVASFGQPAKPLTTSARGVPRTDTAGTVDSDSEPSRDDTNFAATRDVIQDAKKAIATAPIPFILKDWRVSIIDGATYTRAGWKGLWYDMAVVIILATVLLCGIGLALSSASHAMRLSQMKSDFVSNVSHELRTPLCSIRLFAEFLKLGRAKTPDKVIEYGEYIERESRRLSRLIDNILDFSRIESQRKVYRRVPTDIKDVVTAVVRAVDMPLEEVGLAVKTELPDHAGPVMAVDADAIAQALHNLLDNAAKYSKSGGDIIVRLQPHDDHVLISVQDHGIGIAKDDQCKVFDRFHRVSTGLVHDVKGSGLGLSIVQHAAQAHGGHVELESELGVGSTFSLWLPTEVDCIHAEPAGR